MHQINKRQNMNNNNNDYSERYDFKALPYRTVPYRSVTVTVPLPLPFHYRFLLVLNVCFFQNDKLLS